MRADKVFSDSRAFVTELRRLRGRRKKKNQANTYQAIRRASLSSGNRQKVLKKTDGRCHICGGSLEGDDWHADHVLQHAHGGRSGAHSLDNYLPTHSLCNSYRRCFSAEELQVIYS